MKVLQGKEEKLFFLGSSDSPHAHSHISEGTGSPAQPSVSSFHDYFKECDAYLASVLVNGE